MELLREGLMRRLHESRGQRDALGAVDEALDACKSFHSLARSTEAIALAQAALDRSIHSGDAARTVKCLIACGLLCADAGDVVEAIGYHVRALRHAAGNEDRLNMARCWNNLGIALGIAGSYALAARSYERCIALVEPMQGPNFSRYTGYCNLSDACYQMGRIPEAIEHGERSLEEMTGDFSEASPYGDMLHRRNLVRAYLAAGKIDAAEKHMEAALQIAQRHPSQRAHIAADIIRASYELATGRSDVALTRLDQTLARAREIPAALRDTLACVVRAEECAGNAARALLRLDELSDHVYQLAIGKARDHLELAGLREVTAPVADVQAEQDRARLESQLSPPDAPESWKTLQRLALGAAMRIDDTAWHGKRVGALTKALALAHGLSPLSALQMGRAAELHDIGMLSVPE